MRLTKRQQEFIGKKFHTLKGSTLTVIAKDTEVNLGGKWNGKFILECSVCSLDEELWKYGTIKSSKWNLKNGQVPCGCGGTKWSENQFKILVTRFCLEKGYVFHGWSENYRGNKTLLRLENTNTGNFWNSTSIANLFNGRGDPSVAKIENAKQVRVEDKVHINSFLQAGFTEAYTFWRSERLNSSGGKDYWHYFCPKCSNDEYFEAGLCDGIFEAQAGDLKSGQKSCRCSKVYRWTKKQRESTKYKKNLRVVFLFLGKVCTKMPNPDLIGFVLKATLA